MARQTRLLKATAVSLTSFPSTRSADTEPQCLNQHWLLALLLLRFLERELRLLRRRLRLQPRLPCTFLRCPDPNCGQVHAVDDDDATSSGRPTLRSCNYCATEMCVCCGLPWVEADTGARHFGLACQKWLDRRSESSEATRLLQSSPGRKQCPSCASVIERWRDHACHHVTCRCGYSMCYVCLERWPGGVNCTNLCPFRCSSACDCEPCPDCTPGQRCYLCTGACVSCVGETPEQKSEREETQRETRELIMREQKWCGSKQRRPLGSQAAASAAASVPVSRTAMLQWLRDIVRDDSSPAEIDQCAAAEWLTTVSDHLERLANRRTAADGDDDWPGGDAEKEVVTVVVMSMPRWREERQTGDSNVPDPAASSSAASSAIPASDRVAAASPGTATDSKASPDSHMVFDANPSIPVAHFFSR